MGERFDEAEMLIQTNPHSGLTFFFPNTLSFEVDIYWIFHYHQNKMPKDKLSDYDWFVKTDLSRYKGKYVAIADHKVVSSGYDAKKVYEEAQKKAPRSKPALAKIPAEDIMVLMFPPR